MSDATLRCWGQTWDGKPGPGPTVPILSNVAHVAASPESHNLCFIMTDGTFQCTGPNSVLNISTAIDPTLAGVRAVAFGEYDACAIVRDGSVRCWGDGEIVGSPGLSAPTGIVNATSIAVATSPGGTGNLCALTGTGAVLCQGNDQHPAVVVAVPVSGISFLTASVYGSFAATPLDGSSPMEWTALPGQSPTLPVPDGLTNIRSLSLGFTSPPFVPVTYAVDFGGNLWAVSQAAVPTQLAAARFAAVSAGALHQCALGLDGQVYCWGDNSRGQLGGSSLTVPVRF